ncbi:hypothetical protein [Rhodococcus koreensis]|uniref:hypothetical protein n=1 Tax=Rhodococcus koreensis TaxID=99653 RepID=UPI0036D9C875
MYQIHSEVPRLRSPWVVVSALVGVVALTQLSPFDLLGLSSALVLIGLIAFRTEHGRDIAARTTSVGVGLMIAAVPMVVLRGVNSL